MQPNAQRTFRRLLAAASAIAWLPATALGFCTGDCNNDQNVTIDELVMSVGIVIDGPGRVAQMCPNLDKSGDGTASVGEIVGAVNVALKGCQIVQPFAAIQQVFSQSCALPSCHSAQARQGGLVLSDEELSWANLVLQPPTNEAADELALWRVLPGDLERSYLVRKLHGLGPGDAMPQGLPPLSDEIIHMIEDWILRGAPTTKEECAPGSAVLGSGSHRGFDDATDCEGRTPPVGDFEWKPEPPLDAPAKGEGLQFYTPPRTVEPGSEWETCFAFRVDLEQLKQDTGTALPTIKRQLYRMHEGSHHLLLYAYFGNNADDYTFGEYWDCFAGNCNDSADCPADSGQFLLPIGGTQVAGTEYAVDYPPGVGIPILGSHPVIIANLHFQNPFLPKQEIYGESWVNLYFHQPGEFKVILDGIFAINFGDLVVEPYAEKSITRIWRPSGLLTNGLVDAAVFQLFGHMHKRGIEFTIHLVNGDCDYDGFRRDPNLQKYPACEGTQIYRTTEWDNAPVTDYDFPYLRVDEDQGLRWSCTHLNGRRIPEMEPGGDVVFVDDPLYPPKYCHEGCVACGWQDDSRTCVFTRDRSGRVFREGEPMPLVFGALADDDMCNMFGYFINADQIPTIVGSGG